MYTQQIKNALVITSIAGALAALGSASGCSSTTTKQERVILATEHIEDPIRAIQARAELEAMNPWGHIDEGLISSMTPDAIDGLAPGSVAYQRALADEDQIELEVLAGMSLPETPQVEPVSVERKAQAMKVYAQARSDAQAREMDKAIEGYKQAARLDPNSATIQKMLGAALVLTNDQLGAHNAHMRAFTLGDRSPKLMVHLASQASANKEHLKAIWFADQALASDMLDPSTITHSIARVILGSSLIESGYLKVGAQTLGEALETFDTTSRDIEWKQELIGILNNQSGLWMLVGDAWTSVGSYERAQVAYAKTGDDANVLAPRSVVARRMASELRQGHPANAVLIYLDHVAKNATDIGAEETQWARALATIDGIEKVLGPAIGKIGAGLLSGSFNESFSGALTPFQQLLELELSVLDVSRGLDRIAGADAAIVTPGACSVVFAQIDDESERLAAAVALLGARPELVNSVTPAMVKELTNPVAFLNTHGGVESPAAQLLMTSIGIGLGRADLVGHLDALAGSLDVTAIDFSMVSTPWIVAHGQGFALTGRWDHATALIEELETRWDIENGSDAYAGLKLPACLMIAQQPSKAWEVARVLGDDADASLDALKVSARIASTRGDVERAISYLERAIELDPFDTDLYEQLIGIRTGTSDGREPGVRDQDQSNTEEVGRLIRQLGTTRPRSSMYQLIRATELARNGMLDQAESILIEINQEKASQDGGLDLLLSIWKTQQSEGTAEGESDALVDGVVWFEDLLEVQPNSVPLILAIAQGYGELGNSQRALELLSMNAQRMGSFVLARSYEQMLAESIETGSGDGSDESSIDVKLARVDAFQYDRLVGLKSVDSTIELAEVYARRSTLEDTGRIAALFADNIPEGIELLPTQQRQVVAILFALARESEALKSEKMVLEIIEIIDGLSGTSANAMDFEIARMKLLMMARLTDLELAELMETILVESNRFADPEESQTLEALPIQALLGQDRVNDAIMLTAMFATRDGELDRQYMIETFRLLGALGTNTELIGVLEVLGAQGMMVEAIGLTTSALGTPSRGEVPDDLDMQRADLAYTAAAMATAFERDEQASRYYELSLSYDADHAWSNNDYGYMLAEEGERIEYAVELLEKAAAALPDEASIIDSLAWVRYKLGIFDDVVDEDGKVVTLGAISLLVRANELDLSRTNATILLHLGDALWRGGYSERAMTAWLSGEEILRSQLRLANASPTPNQRAINAISSELQSIRYRLQDAESTGKPTLAPLATPSMTDVFKSE